MREVFKAVVKIIQRKDDELEPEPEPEPEDNRQGYLPPGEEDVEFSSWWSDVHRRANSVDVEREYKNYKRNRS